MPDKGHAVFDRNRKSMVIINRIWYNNLQTDRNCHDNEIR